MPAPGGANKIRLKGWRQGSLFKVLDHIQLPSIPNVGGTARVVIVSQDCDVVNESYDAEPMVEAIVAIPLEGKPDGSLTYGKNPCKLPIPFQANDAEAWCQVSVGDRCFLRRSVLEDISPDSSWIITPHGCDILARWLANRYRRAAFPDALNDRLRGVRGRVERALKRQGAELSGVYLRLSTSNELPVSDSYQVILLGVMEEHHFVVSGKRLQTERLIETLSTLFQSCSGIEVVESAVLSEQEFTVAELRVFKNWNYDAITLKTAGDARLPPI